MLVPLAGVIVAATAVGALLLVQADDGQRVVTQPGAAARAGFVMTNPDGSTTPVYVGDDLDVSQLPPGAVGLAPATQEYPDGLTVVNGEGCSRPPTCRRTRSGSVTRRSPCRTRTAGHPEHARALRSPRRLRITGPTGAPRARCPAIMPTCVTGSSRAR